MLILNRTACLGGEVTQLKIGTNHNFNNQQKVRADMFLDIINGKANKPDSNIVINGLWRPDMAGVYGQSEKLLWQTVQGKVDYLIIDNYSELTDKRFLHKNGWTICGLYNDFKPELLNDMIDFGLLNVNDIENIYNDLFEYIKSKYNTKIIFLHFPTTFEKREKYINQGIAITKALNNLAEKFNIQNIHADIDCIEQADSDTYHYTKKTFENMAKKIII